MMTPGDSVLEPAGIQAARIADLFWVYLAISTAVFLLVGAAFVCAIVRRRTPEPATDRSRKRAVAGAIALSFIVLVVMLVLSAATSRALASLGTKNAIQVEVTGHKWWWEFTYPANDAGPQFRTAYEMHVPVGRPIEIKLASADVIHSFWIPSLHGKRDAIPGKNTTLVLEASEPGRYQGQCAEYCGTQHANMRFVVVAESQEDFDKWLAHSRSPSRAPTDDTMRAGLDVFVKSRCIVCHAIGGTEALASVGPDLTHLASRKEVAMGSLPNSRGHLAGWIVDPQSTKPGVVMPGTPLSPPDLNALVAYLGSLE